MKREITLLIASVTIVISMTSGIMDKTGKVGKTNSPGETTCNDPGCHTGNPLNAIGGSVTIVAPTLTNWEYITGQVYTINVTVARTNQTRFGFDFEALTSTGANAGTITVTNATLTRKANVTIMGNSRTNITHTGSGNTGTGTFTFTFDWTAPATNVGNVTFYVAGNAANNSNTDLGDFIYTATQVVTPSLVNGINDHNLSAFNFSIYPNPIRESTTISYNLNENSNVSARLISLTGQTVVTFYEEEDVIGEQKKLLIIDPHIAKGVYILALYVNNHSSYKKVIVE